MRLVNDKVQLALILPHRVGQRFPDGILSFVRFMRQQLIAAELLCVQKVDIAAFQSFAVENRVDGVNVADTDFIGFPIAKGSHKVHIVYHAPLAKAGKAVSAVGIGITGITFAGNAFLRRRKKKPGESISAP